MYFIRQSFFVFGLSKSGCAAAEFLLSQNATTYIYDEFSTEPIERAKQLLVEKGAKIVKAEDLSLTIEYCDALVLSPGIPIDHPLAVAFKRRGRAVLGEAELAARYMCCPIIAITGTNGKTTTVSMLGETLTRGGLTVKQCGNIGVPMIEYCALSEGEVIVAEISSFQCETLQSLRPHIAVVLNVSEDHLNRHYNMENYIFLKSKVLKNCTETEYAVLNYDESIVRAFAEKTKAQTFYFSLRERVRGAYYENGFLYFGKEKILSAGDLAVGGLHNVQNALAVIVCAKIMGIKNEDIVAALTEFKGIKHRIESVGEVDGVVYIDDSKGTNVDATIKAVECMTRETVLLVGGKDKGYDYGKLFEVLPRSKIVHLVIYGENRFSILRSARERAFESFSLCEDFSFAVQVASLKAKSGQCVLLSPASASFDEFANYEERGDRFVEIVHSLKKRGEENGEECAGKDLQPFQPIVAVEEDGREIEQGVDFE